MKNPNMLLEPAEWKDLTEIQTLCVNTIKTVCRKDYSPEQIEAWVSAIEDDQLWTKKLQEQYFLTAILSNEIVGFASLANSNYFDLLYVHKDFQSQGIASKLYEAIEAEAIKRHAVFLQSHVSITAKSFFIQRGFKVVREQLRMRSGVGLINFEMIKELTE
ncbi:MAG TPA: GNAT family N-acetyltransferase [Agriterribacter sp.]|nr:GNAT family N-acetyltransferase [Agriterribacter sp.]